MATIQRVINSANVSYRVFIRKRGFKTLSKTFPTKKLAKQFAFRMESDLTSMISIGGMSSKTLFKNLMDEYLLKEYKGSRPKEYYQKLCYWIEILGDKLIIDVPYCFTKPWKRALEDADIKDFRFLDLLHSCSSYLAYEK